MEKRNYGVFQYRERVRSYFLLHIENLQFFTLFVRIGRVQYALESISSDDWDMSEEVNYLIDFSPDQQTIQSLMRIEVEAYLDAIL